MFLVILVVLVSFSGFNGFSGFSGFMIYGAICFMFKEKGFLLHDTQNPLL